MPFSSFVSRARAIARLFLVAVIWLAAQRADAQGGGEPPGYRRAIGEALSEYRLGHFPEARALFTEAHQIYPNARTLRGLGMAAFELRNYRESIEYLEQALASEVKPLDGRLRGETESLLQRANRFVARIRLVLSPPDTAVTIDHHPVRLPPADKPLLIEPGLHVFEFNAEGHQSEQREIDVKGREIVTWTIQLAELPPPPPPPAPAAVAVPDPAQVAARAEPEPPPMMQASEPAIPAEPPKRPVYKNPWLWVGVGIGVTALAVGIGIAASGDSRTESAPPSRTPNTPGSNGILAASWSLH